MKKLSMVGLNNSHPYVFGGLINGGRREIFVRNSPAWTHSLFPDHDWTGDFSGRWKAVKAWSRSPRFAAEVAEAVMIDELTETLEEAAADVDAGFVCDMWGDYHLEQALAFLRQGKSVYVDKPLSETVEDALAMIEAARTSGAVLSTCSANRFAGEIAQLKSELADKLGPPSIITVCCPCYQDLARYTVHGIEMLMEVMKGRKVARLRNTGPGTRRHLLLLDFADGACGVIHSWEGHAYSITVQAPGGQRVTALDSHSTYKTCIAAVLDSFETGIPVVPYDEALEVVRVIEAGVASQNQGGASIEF